MSDRLSYRKHSWLKIACGVFALLLFIAAFPCYQAVRAERDRIARQPHVFSFGQGSGNHYTYWLRGTGESVDEVDRRIGEAVSNWVATEPAERAEQFRNIELKHPHSLALSIEAPRFTSQILANLHEFPRSPLYRLHLAVDVDQFTPEGFAALRVLTNLDGLHLGPRIRGVLPERKLPHLLISKSDMAHVEHLRDLKQLSFSHVRLAPNALDALNDLEDIEWLGFDDVRFEPECLAAIRNLGNLKSLSIQFTPLTDDDLSNLRDLHALNDLWLDDTQITDAGLVHLKGLKNLDELSVSNTGVSEAGVAELKVSLPTLHVTR